MKIHTERTVGFAHLVHTDADSKCFRLHGHNWRIEVEITGPVCGDGMVMDFGDIKEVIDQLDHKTVIPGGIINNVSKVWSESEEPRLSSEEVKTISFMTFGKDKGIRYYELPEEDVFIFPSLYGAVTSENVSEFIKDEINKVLVGQSLMVDKGVKRVSDPDEYEIKVKVWEGERSWAE